MEHISRKEKVTYLKEQGLKDEEIDAAFEFYSHRQKFLAMEANRYAENKTIRDLYQRQLKNFHATVKVRREASSGKK